LKFSRGITSRVLPKFTASNPLAATFRELHHILYFIFGAPMQNKYTRKGKIFVTDT